jgi:NTE family protein
LVLQGGGALGAYQAGVFEALSHTPYAPDWLAGISIGAINSALIAGNPPEQRVARLREFWEKVSSGLFPTPLAVAREYLNRASAAQAMLLGAPGFFTPRLLPPLLQPRGTLGALSFYDTTPLARTLERLVDFDRINSGAVRLSVGAVNVRTGNLVYFDSARQDIDARHIMASGALPPGFPPVEIDGEWYWDGGLVSNTPLHHVLDQPSHDRQLVFQVDLFPAHGELPSSMAEVGERAKDIRYSSRTRLVTTQALDRQVIAGAAQRLLAKLPPELQEDPDAQALARLRPSCAAVDVVHLIYRSKRYENHAKDYEFSRRSMEEHWQSGLADMQTTLRDSRWLNQQRRAGGLRVFDLVPPGPGDAVEVSHDRRRPEMQRFRRAAA